MRHAVSICLLSFCLALTGCAKDESTAPAEESMAKDAVTSEAPEVADPKTAVATPTTPAAPKVMPGQLSAADRARLEKTVASSFGKGSFEDSAGDTYTFTMQGDVLEDQSGYGNFRFYSFRDGGKMDVKGEMTCVKINSAERRIWLSGKITENTSTEEKFRSGQYAAGNYVQFRARPNSMDGENPAAMEVPAFVDQSSAEAFCDNADWSDDVLYELGENDLIAAIP